MNPLDIKALAAEVEPIGGDPATIQDLATVFSNLLITAIPLIGLISFIMIIVGGFTILSSAGNPENVKKGQMTITFAVGGVILAILAWIILQTLETLTGVNVTLFKFGFE